MTSATTSVSAITSAAVFSEPPRRPIAAAIPIRLARTVARPIPHDSEEPMLESPPPEWVTRVAFACVEVAYGRRSLQQLRSLTTRSALRSLEILQEARSKHVPPSTKLSIGPVHISSPAKDVLETSLTVMLDRRALPFALRLERHGQLWLICAIEMGPH